MNARYWKLILFIQGLVAGEEGQDLVEYALCVALVALSAFVGIRAAAQSILNFFQALLSVIDTNFA